MGLLVIEWYIGIERSESGDIYECTEKKKQKCIKTKHNENTNTTTPRFYDNALPFDPHKNKTHELTKII